MQTSVSHFQQGKEQPDHRRQQENSGPSPTTRRLDYRHMQNYTQQYRNTHSSQVHRQDSPGWTTYSATEMSVNVKKVENIQNPFSDHNAGRLDINSRRKSGKFQVWRLNDNCLASQWIQEESTKEIRKITWDKWEQKYNVPKLVGFSETETTGEKSMWSHVRPHGGRDRGCSALRQGMPGAPTSSKRQEGFSLRVSRRKRQLCTPTFQTLGL